MPTQGVVVACGPGARNRDGKLMDMQVKVGDKVLLPEYGGQVLQDSNSKDGEELLLFQDHDILGVLAE